MKREAAHDSRVPLSIGNDSRRSFARTPGRPGSDHHGQDVASAQIARLGAARTACRPTETCHQNGGSARGYQELPAPLAIPATATQTAARDRIFMHRQHSRELTLLPHTARSVVGME